MYFHISGLLNGKEHIHKIHSQHKLSKAVKSTLKPKWYGQDILTCLPRF